MQPSVARPPLPRPRRGAERGVGEVASGSGFEVGYDKGAGITVGSLARFLAWFSNFAHAQMDLNEATSEWRISEHGFLTFGLGH